MGTVGETAVHNPIILMKTSLDSLQPGDVAQVTAIDTQNVSRLNKLSALGLVPGSLIRLQQRRPAFVVRVGETQLSLDDAVAREIIVQPLAER
ncbi:MAG: ferrous iron transport protein A [Ardenticatenaceae bacterium]|nr:ferrous iron transport protein A [Ardenticatenaceae bacterium]